MPVPVIDPSTSVLAYPQWEYWEYQPYATFEPTSWTCSPLPPGIVLDSATGKISGAGTTPGVYVVQLIATNATGPSTIGGRLVIGIEMAAFAPNSAINVDWDTQTGEITLIGHTGQAPTSDEADARVAALLAAKLDDDLLFFVRLRSQTTYLDVPITALKFSVKEFEPDGVVALSSSGFVKVGTGPRTYYIVHCHLDRTKLKGVLSNYETDYGTFFGGLAEFERVEENVGYPDLTAGPPTIRSTSRTFVLTVERDQVE